jgi:hypothetical protein
MHLQIQKNNETLEELTELLGPSLAKRAYADFERGNNLRLAKALSEQAAVGRSNANASHRGVDGIGQVGARMATSLQHELRRLYGQDALQDEAFIDRLNRDNPNFNFKPAYQRKTRIIKSI